MTNRRAWGVGLALILCIGSGYSLRADSVVYFRNGRAIQVVSHKNDGDWVILSIDEQGEVQVPAFQILRIEPLNGGRGVLASRARSTLVKRQPRQSGTMSGGSEQVVSTDSKVISEEIQERLREQDRLRKLRQTRAWDFPFKTLREHGATMTPEEMRKEKDRIMKEMSKRIHTVYGAARTPGRQ